MRAGASLINMEFVQFHPTGMVWPPSVKGLLVTESVRGDGGILKNSEGKRFMFDYIPEFFKAETADTIEEADRWYDDKKNNRRPPELLPRDEVARAINSEIKAGRGTPHGGIYLDIASRRTPEFIRKRLPSMYHQFKELADVDITAEPMEIGPTCHYVMGGVEVDADTQESAVTGLYAVGECSGGMHGSNRLGGNSLGDLLVFGKRAGEAATAYASSLGDSRPQVDEADVKAAQTSALAPFEVEGGENPYTIQSDLQQSMNDLVGIIRTRPELEESLREIEAFKVRADTMVVEGHRQYNPGWHLALDLRNMLIVSECIAKAALAREESRGGHTRDDFPGPDPEWGTKNLVVNLNAAGTGVDLHEKALPEMPDELKEYFDDESTTLKLRIWRGDKDGGEIKDFPVEVSEGEVVLDAIHRVQATQAGDLAVRWNCKAGKCGSCSAEVNGRPRLMCMCRLSDFEEDEVITVTPMRTFPVIRDLVTDVSFNYEKAKELPSFSPPPRDADGKRRMAQIDVERGQEFRKCIECFLCQNVCHVVRDHEDNKQAFSGPRFFLRYAELDMHPLDTHDRRELAQGAAGLGMCNITKCCTEVCPEGIKITDNAIIPMKERVVDRKYDPLVWLGNKIGLRTKDDEGRTEV